MKPQTNGTLIWDIPTRLFHWVLFLCVSGAFLSAWFYQHIPFIAHEIRGATALVLIAFRLFWGFVGPAHARFSDFLRGPKATLSYLRAVLQREPPPVSGHTPTGGWMILLLLLLVGAQASLGLFSNDETDSAGPFYAWVSHSTSNKLSGLHGLVADCLMVAIALHVIAVIFYKVVLKEDLVRALLTGRRQGVPESAAISSHRLGLAIIILAVCAGVLVWLIRIAPPLPSILM